MAFIVRPVPDARLHEYIGEVYIDGIMNGEAWDKKSLECIPLV